jgi:outer membrane protein, heavy metal efflux system
MTLNPKAHVGAKPARRVNSALIVCATAGLLCFSGVSMAQTPATLTEAEAVRLALDNPRWAGVDQARRQAAEARARAAGAQPAPEIEVVREGADGFSGTGTEDSARLRYSVDLFGVRRALRQAGLAARDAEVARSDLARAARIAEVRRAFHGAVGLTARAAAQRRYAERLRQAGALVAKRTAAGDASDLELSRIQAEAQSAMRTAERLESEATQNLSDLSLLTGAPAPRLQPSPAPLPALEVLLSQMADAPEARRLEAEARAAEASAAALDRRARTPSTALIGGLRSVDEPSGRSTGAIVGAVVTLPFGAGPKAEAQAQSLDARALRAEADIANARRRGNIASAHAAAQRLSALASAVTPYPERTIRAAEAAYEAGEIDINELLAVHRSAAEADAAAATLQQDAALARVRLDELVGKTQP